MLILLLLALAPLIWSLPSLLTALSFLCLGLCRRGHRSRAPSLPGQVQPPLYNQKKWVKRAWHAGQWGGAVLSGRVRSPNRFLRPRYYAILRAEPVERPVLCTSAGAYWRIIGDLESSNSVSHSFPSDLEAKTHLSGAGVAEFDTVA